MSKNFFQTLLFVIFYLLLTSVASASRLYFEPAPASVEGQVAVAVKLDAEMPVNVFEAAVKIPAGVSFVRTSNGGSIVELWIEEAKYNAAARELSFAGMVPGGFSGKGGKVLTIYTSLPNGGNAASVFGEFAFASDRTTLYRNTPDALLEEAELVSSSARAMISGSLALGEKIVEGGGEEIDTEPPYDFFAAVSRNPEMFEGNYYVAFYARDILSGVLRYEVAERSGKEVFQYHSLDWHTASSPYILSDQSRKAHVYVKAVDHAGNERIIAISPPGLHEYSQGESRKYLIWSIIILCLSIFSLLALISYSYYSSRRRS